MERSLAATVKVRAVQKLGTRQLTRAHHALNRRPELVAAANGALQAVAQRLGTQLGVAVGATARLVDASVTPAKSLSALSGFAELELSSLGETALLEVELPFLAALLARLSSGAPVPAVAFALTKLEEAASGYLCLVGISALRNHAEVEKLFAPRLVRVHTQRALALAACSERWRWMTVEISLDVGGEVGIARLLLPAQPLQASLAAVPESASTELAPEILAASLPVTVRVGRTQLAREVADQLAQGDVVLVEKLQRADSALLGSAQVFVSGFALEGELQAEGFLFSSAAPSGFPQEHPMSSAGPFAGPAGSSLSVDVHVELTQLRLTVGELSTLRPGALLGLRCNASEPVTLWIGDRAVARAELVEIEGELGARILTLNP